VTLRPEPHRCPVKGCPFLLPAGVETCPDHRDDGSYPSGEAAALDVEEMPP
jgi:hypothetical protein